MMGRYWRIAAWAASGQLPPRMTLADLRDVLAIWAAEGRVPSPAKWGIPWAVARQARASVANLF